MRSPRLFTFMILLCWLSANGINTAQAEARLLLRTPSPSLLEPESTGRFYIEALKLALHKTAPPHEDFQLEYLTQRVGRERLRLMVAQNDLDIMWSSSTPEREEQLEPVRFNLLRGINEYRFLLIRAEDQEKFAQIDNLEQLRQMRAGAGTHWSDAQILRDHGFEVATSWNHGGLFRMLSIKRFDFMARTYNEIQHELATYPEYKLAAENHLLLHYQQPIYYFVRKGNQALAQRIERGLALAQADGSLDELFFSIPDFKTTWDHLQLLQHKVIYLTPINSSSEPTSSTGSSAPVGL